MYTALFKVTTWQGKLVIKNPKNSTNNIIRSPLFNYILLTEHEEKRLQNKYHHREGKRSHWDLLSHRTMKQECRENNSQYIAWSLKAVPPRTLETLLNKETKGWEPVKNPPEKRNQMDSNPSKIAENVKNIRQARLRGNWHQVHRLVWSLF